MNKILILLLSVMLFSCSDKSGKPETSTSIDELEKYIQLTGHKPIKVKWAFIKRGSQTNSRVPEPEDYTLEAVLYYDAETIKELEENYLLLSVTLREYNKEQFRFEWLDKKNLSQLNGEKTFFYYHPNFFKKGSLIHGGYIILNDTTILLSLFTM